MSARYGMVIDLDRCTGCGSCMVACAAENNVPSLPQATARTGLTPMLVRKVSNGMEGTARRETFIPIMCMHCEHETPCVNVCPQQAVEVDKATGIVMQMPQRCLGCRYCMTACPYHARYFNWWDPAWPAGMEKSLNPGVAVADARCGGEMQPVPRAPAFGEWKRLPLGESGRSIRPTTFRLAWRPARPVPSDSATWPTRTIQSSQEAHSPDAFRLLARIGTEPKVYYKSKEAWVRALAESSSGPGSKAASEVQHG